MLPHAGVGGCTPKPRNEIAASATMNCANCRLATITIEGATLGSTCRNSTRARPTPRACAACTNSRCFTDSTSPRTTRAYTTQPATDKLTMMLRRPSPTMALMVSASRMNGKESCTSAIRMSTAPGQPSKKPASSPSRPPTRAVSSTQQSPMKSATRVP